MRRATISSSLPVTPSAAMRTSSSRIFPSKAPAFASVSISCGVFIRLICLDNIHNLPMYSQGLVHAIYSMHDILLLILFNNRICALNKLLIPNMECFRIIVCAHANTAAERFAALIRGFIGKRKTMINANAVLSLAVPFYHGLFLHLKINNNRTAIVFLQKEFIQNFRFLNSPRSSVKYDPLRTRKT